MLYDVFINQIIYKMTAEELLKPRFVVIADYPLSTSPIGYILEDLTELKVKTYSNYPHLFKRLNWWEYRKIEDMPKKLHCKAIKGDAEIQNIEEWDMEILVGWTNKAKRECCSLLSFKPEYGYFPVD